MSVAACPRCHDEVTVPGGAPPEAVAQCPLCGEEFELAEVLGNMPPALVIVHSPHSAPTTGPESDTGHGFDFAPSATDDGDEFRLAPDADETDSDAPSFAFDDDSPADTPSTGAGSKSITARPSKKKKKSNPILEGVKIVGGGALGIFIALVLMWYLPWGYDKDPLDLGPQFAKVPVLQSIVPEKYRGNAAATNNDDSSSTDSVPEPEFRLDPGPDDGSPKRSIADYGPNGGEGESDFAMDEENNNQDQPSANEPSGDELDSAADLAANNDPTELPMVDFDDIEADGSTDDSSSTPPGPKAPGGQPLGPRQRPQVSPADLQATVEAVNQSAVAYAESVDQAGPERVEIAKNHYNDYASMAEAITFIDQTDPSILAAAKSAEQALQDLAKAPAKTSIMQYFANKQLEDPGAYPPGILLVGTVTKTRAKDRLYYSTVKISPKNGDPREVTIVSPANPADASPGFKQGSQVALLGALVAEPSKNLRGYQGEEPIAVWGGYFLVFDPGA